LNASTGYTIAKPNNVRIETTKRSCGIGTRVFINDVEIPGVLKIGTEHSIEGKRLMLTICAAELEIISVDPKPQPAEQ